MPNPRRRVKESPLARMLLSGVGRALIVQPASQDTWWVQKRQFCSLAQVRHDKWVRMLWRLVERRGYLMDEEAAMTAMGLERESYCRREQREEGLRYKRLQRAGVLGGFAKKKYQKSVTDWLRSGALYGMGSSSAASGFRRSPRPLELQTQAPRRLHARNLEPATIYT